MSTPKKSEPMTTILVRLHPTREQAEILQAHCQEYIAVVNVLARAIDADMLGPTFSTKDFSCPLPSAVKNQALRDAHSVYQRSLDLGVIPVLKKPLVQWNNQNWRLTDQSLALPVSVAGKTCSMVLGCEGMVYVGKPGMLRIKKKRGKWMAEIALSLPEVMESESEVVMGVDLGIKVPAASYTRTHGAHFYGNGRSQRARRRRFYARRKSLQQAKKKRALRKSQGKEQRWMKEINHQISRQIITQAQTQGVGVIKLESLAGIRKGTTRTSRGAKARKNNRMQNTWSFYQLTLFITYKAQRAGIRVVLVDPAHTSKDCPVCRERNRARDRTYVCSECGWMGHRDVVGAINISRRAGLADQRQGAGGA